MKFKLGDKVRLNEKATYENTRTKEACPGMVGRVAGWISRDFTATENPAEALEGHPDAHILVCSNEWSSNVGYDYSGRYAFSSDELELGEGNCGVDTDTKGTPQK